MTTIGERVKEARLHKGLTQAELGRHVGLTADKINKIEKGTRGVDGNELLTIAEVTETRYEDLIRERMTIAFRGKEKRTQAEIDAAMAVIDRFTDNWMRAWALEEAFL